MLPAYGWKQSRSAMHTADSSLDGTKKVGTTLVAATLKSGPRCLNDEMSENFANAIVSHAHTWVTSGNAHSLEWTYGVLYDSRKQSNKKDSESMRKFRS